jgi:ABC-type transport system involved in Fe-S cluster assembly fused permease/ATPase subunit
MLKETSQALSWSLFDILYYSRRLVVQADRIRRFARLRTAHSTLEAPLDVLALPMVSDKGMRIEFDDVHFRYPGRTADRRAIRGLSFSIEPGEVIAVVGDNGSGKSTLVNLLARLWDVDAGCVKLNGVDVRRLRGSEIHAAMQILWQTAAKFDLSIAEFIAAGDLCARRLRRPEFATLTGVAQLGDASRSRPRRDPRGGQAQRRARGHREEARGLRRRDRSVPAPGDGREPPQGGLRERRRR